MPSEDAAPSRAISRLGEIYEALDVTPDGDARTLLLDELREELWRIDQDRCADGAST